MSVVSRRPLRTAGANLDSGNVNTGEVCWNRGGVRAGSVYSGAIAMATTAAGPGALASGGSILFFSGPGRLNSFTALFPAGVALAGGGEPAILSGQPIVVYDSDITARSGVFTDATISESGRPIMYAWYPPRVLSGVNITGPGFDPVAVDRPFTSGLCVMALSGAPGFTVSYSPEINQAGQ